MTTEVRLEELADRHRDGYQAMLREWIDADGFYPHNDAVLALEDWAGFLADVAAERAGHGLPPGVEPQITLVGLTPADDVVGEFRLRPWRAAPYHRGNGHLGYNVRHTFRRQGVAREGLRQLRLLAGSEYGLAVVAFDVDETNVASQRVALANDGRVVERVENRDGSVTLWFECPTLSSGVSGRGRGR
jgi:predicted acetyltransferase